MNFWISTLLSVTMLAGCAGSGSGPATVERMYVINCGENHVKDLAYVE